MQLHVSIVAKQRIQEVLPLLSHRTGISLNVEDDDVVSDFFYICGKLDTPVLIQEAIQILALLKQDNQGDTEQAYLQRLYYRIVH